MIALRHSVEIHIVQPLLHLHPDDSQMPFADPNLALLTHAHTLPLPPCLFPLRLW